MKPTIHPQYYEETQVVCTSCGNTFTTGSAKQHIMVEICYHCHPFYTGEQKFLDTKGRVELFQKKQQTAKELKQKILNKKQKKEIKEEKQVKSLKELLSEV